MAFSWHAKEWFSRMCMFRWQKAFGFFSYPWGVCWQSTDTCQKEPDIRFEKSVLLRTGPLGFTSCLHDRLLFFLRPPPGWLVLLLTTVCPAPLRFSKDLKVFHHRPRHCFHSDSPALSRQPGGLSRGGKFVSSGNTVFSLFLTLRDKQGCWNWWETRCYFLDVFFCLCCACSLVVKCSSGQPELLTCTRSGDSLHVCVFSFSFANWTRVFARTATSNDWRANQMLQEKLSKHLVISTTFHLRWCNKNTVA